MSGWHLWLILGIIFFIIEIFTPAFFFASIGTGAFVAGIAAYFGCSLTTQVALLSAATFIIFIGIRPFLKWLQRGKEEKPETGVKALIGQEARVLEQIGGRNAPGRIRLGGEEWRACAIEERTFPKNSMVVVVKIEGVTAYVKES